MKLSEAIVYMKMDELREACRDLQILTGGQKRELTGRLLAKVEGVAVTGAVKSTRRIGQQMYSREALMRPGTYRNGAQSRSFFQKEIGAHFRFTTFGMDWIKQHWANGQCPSFGEFIHFWTEEYDERRQGKDFASKPKLARVNFFRRVSRERKVTKAELEQLWSKERCFHVQQARSILAAYRT